MATVRQHPRRTEGARRLIDANLPRGVRSHGDFSGHPCGGLRRRGRSSRDEGTEQLVSQMIETAKAGAVRDDPTFGEYAPLFGFFRSCVMQEGRLLELAIADAVDENPSLSLLPPRPMPIVPAAVEMLKRTPGHVARGIRFPSRVHSTEAYRPDLFIVDEVKHTGLMLDIKRSLTSYRPREIERLRFRMLAVASIASEWVAERQGPVLVEVETAIIDGADEVSDHDHGIFPLSEIDELLGKEGVLESITRARALFAEKVQMELRARCRGLVFGDGSNAPDFSAEHNGVQAGTTHPSEIGPPHSATVRPVRFGYAKRPNLH